MKPFHAYLLISLWISHLLYSAEKQTEKTVITLDLHQQSSSNLQNEPPSKAEHQAEQKGPHTSPQHWLTELLINSVDAISEHPKLKSHDLTQQQNTLERDKAKTPWLPQINASQNYNESERVSFSFTEGAGTVTNTNERSQIDLSKRFDTGTQLNLSVNQNEADNSSADRVARETVSSSVSLAITQSLLKGRSKTANNFSITEVEHSQLSEEHRRKKTLESQLLDFGKMCLELAEHQATIDIRKEHLKIARQERETERVRVEQKLSPQRKLLSHQRNVLDLELKLASLTRRMETLKKEFQINWPGLHQISNDLLNKVTQTDYRGSYKDHYDYDHTRSGKTWLSTMNLDKTRIAVMNHRKLDQLDFNLSYNRNGTAQDQSDSWNELRKGDANEWRVGLTYRHTFGKDNDRLNYLSAKISSNKNYQQYADAKITWNKNRILLIEEYQNSVDDMQQRYQLLRIQEMEKDILDEELSEDLVTLEEVFNADKNLLNSKINIISQRKQQRLIDLKLKAHDEILLELLP